MQHRVKRIGSQLWEALRAPLQLLLWSFALLWAVESLGQRSVLGGLRFWLHSPGAAVYNLLIYLLSLCLPLLSRRRRIWQLLISVLWLGLGIANSVMMSLRGTPLTGNDFALIKSAWTVIFSYLSPWLWGLILLAAAAAVAGFVLLWKRTAPCPVNPVAAWGSVAVSALALLLLGGSFHARGVFPRELGDLTAAYREHGFAYCLGRSSFERGVEQPELSGDGETADIDAILAALRKAPTEGEALTESPNILFLQLECFMDPQRIKGLGFSQDPTPTFNALRAEYPSGYLTVPSYGGGTANTEFEIITGMNLLYFGTGEYPYDTILQHTACESVAFNLKEQGYTAHAIHNHNGGFYQRNQVYPHLGFDTFTSLEYMQNVSCTPNGYAKDAVLTKEILQALTSTPGRDAVYTVSVQAHGRYPDTLPEGEWPIAVSGERDEARHSQLTYYVNQLYEVDCFLQKLLRELQEYPEPVLLVLYGDHLPALELTDEELSRGGMYQSEYVIWSNYSLAAEGGDLYAYQLSARMLELAGFENGVFTRLHQKYRNNPNYQAVLNLLEYDVLYGNLNTYGGEVVYVPTDMQMGTVPITVTELRLLNGELFVYGQGFTPYSVVEIDDVWKDTEYLNDTMLRVPEYEGPLTGFAAVQQLGEDTTRLSLSPALRFDLNGGQ